MTSPDPPQNGSRLEIHKPIMNDHTPDLSANKKMIFPPGGSSSKPPSSGFASMTKPSGSKPGLFAKPKMNVNKKF